MQEPSTPRGGETLVRAERLVILQLAGNPRGRPREQVIRNLRRVGQERVEQAIASLAAVGIIVSTGCSVRQSSALERFDALGYIEV